MNPAQLTPDQALKAHRQFLQEILAEVMKILAVGDPSSDRLGRSLQQYWEACFARRALRREVLAATEDSEFERAVEPMGKPFLMMVLAELIPEHGKHNAEQLALMVYDAAREIAVDEALANERVPARRKAVLDRIRP